MFDDLDLNTNNYSIPELEKLLNISRPYHFEIIQINAIKLKHKIRSLSLQKRKENELEIFIKNIIDILERNYIAKSLQKIRKRQKVIETKLDNMLCLLSKLVH